MDMIKDFKDKIAVITGAACGIGRSLAFSFAKRGMKIALVDINKELMSKVAEELRKDGTEVLELVVDVSDRVQVADMADKVYDHFGKVHILCNNAGVAAGGPTHLMSLTDWDWVFSINFFGVLYGVKAFLPRMLECGEPCHIINTASIAGLIPEASVGPYTASKYATVGLTESLIQQYFASNVKFSVLCPGFVKTDLHVNSQKLGKTKTEIYSDTHKLDESFKFFMENFSSQILGGIAPEIVSEKVIEAIEQDIFYILTHPEFIPLLEGRLNNIKEATLALNKDSMRTIEDYFLKGDLAIYENQTTDFSVKYPNNWVPVSLSAGTPINFIATNFQFMIVVIVMDVPPDVELKNVTNMISMFLGGMGTDIKVIANREAKLKDNVTIAYEGEIEYKRSGLNKTKNLILSVIKETKLISVMLSHPIGHLDKYIKKILYSLEFK